MDCLTVLMNWFLAISSLVDVDVVDVDVDDVEVRLLFGEGFIRVERT